ncbi:embryonic stem cell-related gene protein [Pan troglodytes]|uniref:embryonic stem cell-related gene protein n=1 Tax=Pan troglodytes TaxID=9598 RepID=UPI0030135E55
MFGACYKQPLKPSGSEPSAEECRMTPRHAGCDVTEMQRILSQPTFTEHLLRAVCLVNGKGSLSRPQDSVLGSLARKNLRRIHRVSKASYFYIEGCTLTDETMTDVHDIWCRDSDRGTSLGRSIRCPPALCSMRKIHLRPLVLRPKNISPILNWVSGLFLLSSPTSLTIPKPLSPLNLGTILQSLSSLNFSSFPFLVETEEMRFIHEPKTPAPVTDSGRQSSLGV